MYLYEKDKNVINVYELKERRDKLFEFKRKEMEKKGKDGLVCSVFSNSKQDIKYDFILSAYKDITDFKIKDNLFFKPRNGIKLVENNYNSNTFINIDGLLYQFYCGDYDFPHYNIKTIYYTDETPEKNLLLTTTDIKQHITRRFDKNDFEFELPNIISLPESIYLLRLLIHNEFDKIYDKNIDEQLSLYDFQDTPIKNLDLETIEFVNSKFLTNKDFEANNCILKKVRQINK